MEVDGQIVAAIGAALTAAFTWGANELRKARAELKLCHKRREETRLELSMIRTAVKMLAMSAAPELLPRLAEYLGTSLDDGKTIGDGGSLRRGKR